LGFYAAPLRVQGRFAFHCTDLVDCIRVGICSSAWLFTNSLCCGGRWIFLQSLLTAASDEGLPLHLAADARNCGYHLGILPPRPCHQRIAPHTHPGSVHRTDLCVAIAAQATPDRTAPLQDVSLSRACCDRILWLELHLSGKRMEVHCNRRGYAA